MKVLITGGCGFVGSNLAAECLSRGYKLAVFDNLSRFGSEKNLSWLKERGEMVFFHGDIRNQEDISVAVKSTKPDIIFHLAGQVAMTTSLERPRKDFEINANGSLNLLEAVREHSAHSVLVYSSTNKVYGDLENLTYELKGKRYICKEFPEGFDESLKLNFSTPYGCSKGAADQYFLDYYKTFGVKTVVLRHSSMYGGRQFPSFDQGWVGWFCKMALETKNNPKNSFTVSGDGYQVRDLLHADDVVDLYFKVAESEKGHGNFYNVGGGIENSMSIMELLEFLSDHLEVDLNVEHIAERKHDQKFFVASGKKLLEHFKWQPQVDKKKGVASICEWLGQN